MRKLSFLAIASAALFLSSCVNKDDYGYDPNYDTKAAEYRASFVSQFGDIPEDQSWDFYATAVNNAAATRSAGNVVITKTTQPSDIDFTTWQNMLESGVDNSDKGTHLNQLISPLNNGKFKAYAVWYAGWYETYAKYGFELGMVVNNDTEHPITLFSSRGLTSTPSNVKSDFSANPGFAVDIAMDKGDKFYFYMKYNESGDAANPSWVTINGNEGSSTLLYRQDNATEKLMVIGFEDKRESEWAYSTPDFNDVILYLQGDPELPIPEAKRYMCEDMGTIGDFDFNDIVFDVQPTNKNGKALVTVQAAGGTLPATLYVNDQEIGEVHQLLGCSSKTMVNTIIGGTTVTPYKKEINVSKDFDLTNFDNFKVVVINEDGTTREIKCSSTGEAPCVIITPIETDWMKETLNIKNGYPSFFKTDWYKTYDQDKLYILK